jgi:septum formation protein
MMLVLASNSPRRKQLMSLGGWKFSVLAPQVNESVHAGEPPAEYVLRLARAKARAASALLETPVSPDTLIVAADTTVVDNLVAGGLGGSNPDPNTSAATSGQGEILGKPADAREAEAMLRRLRGRAHQVYTGLAVFRPAERTLRSRVVVTDVPMRDFSDAEMFSYIASGDPLDKAGAYAIQHAGFRPVESLSGCYANVMGLPVCHLARLLAEFGERPNTDLAQECMSMLDYPCPIFRQALGLDS